MAKCEICGKGPQFGHNVSHSKRQLRVCSDCMRTLKKV